MSESVNVNFRVTGGDIQSYMDRIQQKGVEMSRTFLKNAEAESDVAKDQLKSYQDQLSVLERKLKTENEFTRAAVQINRDNKYSLLNKDISQRSSQLDLDLERGIITKKQHRIGQTQLISEREEKSGEIEDQFRQELKNAQDQRRDNSLLIRTMRENVDTIKSTSTQELNQMRKGDESLVDAIRNDEDPNSLLANRLSTQQFIEEQAKEEEKRDREKEARPESTFGALLKALAIERVGGLVSSIPSTKNELDYVKPILSIAGMAIGGLMGSLADVAIGTKIFGIGVGQTNLGSIGVQFGEKMGEFAGSALERTFKSREELTFSNYRLQAITGINLGVDNFSGNKGMGGTGKSDISTDLSRYGLDYKEAAELQYRIAIAQANGRNLRGGVENAIALQQGLGVNQDVFIQLSELLRSSKDQNRDVLRLVGGIAAAGRNNIFSQDRTFLGEFLQKNFSGLQRTLLQTQNNVASGTTFDILKRFDSIGGPFAARDLRSMGLINTIQNSLVNPGSDNLKALSFIALREANPNIDLASLLEERQKGLASPAYLKSILQYVDRLGGDQSMKIINTAEAFGLENNIAAARKLYNNREKLMRGEVSTQELIGQGDYSENSIRQLGQSQTGQYTKSTAEIENAFIESAVDGVKFVGTRMKDLFGDMIDGLEIYIREAIESKILQSKTEGTAAMKSNLTFKPGDSTVGAAIGEWGGSMLGTSLFGASGTIIGGLIGYNLGK